MYRPFPALRPLQPGLLAGALLLAAGFRQPSAAQTPTAQSAVIEVKTHQGRLQGIREANLCVFRGIPYAQAPVGGRRFRPPQPLPRWQGPRAATGFGPKATQAGGPAGVQGQEDCLYLNVWAPAWSATAKRPPARPVVVWVHGGAFTGGSGEENDTWTFAAQDSIVAVSLNYRLGSLGFLQAPAAWGPAYAQAGNCGLLDAVAALRWVQANIRAFGGDPRRVTVMGESAGAKLVGALLAAPAAEGLFQRVILESGAVQAIRDTATAGAVSRQLRRALPAGTDLRTAPAEALVRAQLTFASGAGGLQVFGPVLDGRTLPQPPLRYLRRARPRPVLLGTNREEAGLFTGPGSAIAEPNEAALQLVFGQNGARVWQAYQRAQQQAVPDAWNRTLTDYLYRLATYRLADSLAAAGAPVWLYRFDGPGGAQRPVHAQELAYVWNAPAGASAAAPAAAAPGAPRKTADATLAAAMHARWARFIKTGQPGPDWPAYTPANQQAMIFGPAIGPAPASDAYQDPTFPTQAYRR
ncbi:carboxylesterase family protein [Hymenobacter sp. 15J16-1T3B]|uniref:carboxylesterase/lipase family protein n=1 Tax=Hymenobacter sp. 15J16-1T3B TaxID=2886941 RepID=UPI001D129B5A|nr:carboxylesterase family protein [Hymenobacter sp. 15J16-1T3B]MCC3156182.1 carboxylesterase family protein [Hymenobacter sp. 15J16-1T3B]